MNNDYLLDKLNSVVDEKHVLTNLKAFGCLVDQTGSQYTCNPPPGDSSDTDYLVYTKSQEIQTKVFEWLNDNHFVFEGDPEYDFYASNFTSVRKSHLNLIVTPSVDFRNLHILATNVCKKLNILDKKARITIFKAILYKEFENDEDLSNNF